MQIAERMMFAVVWSDASAVTRPGGMCGPSAKTTRITPTMLATAQMTAIRRRWSRPGSEVEVAAI